MNEQNIPIDIHSSKLLDWLISRRHSNKDWYVSVDKIREQINHAIQDMPEHPKVVALLSGSYINYFNCKQIVEILKETEADSKNMFGYYSSQRIKDWQSVISAYEKNGCYLADSAQLLQRLVQFEVPAIKKQMANARKTAEESTRKHVEYLKSAKDAERAFDAECAKWNIQPSKSVRNELIKLAQDIPSYLNEIALETKKLTEAVAYYKKFRSYVADNDRLNSDETILGMLTFVERNGNATHYQWRTGTKPVDIVQDEIKWQQDDDDNGAIDEQEIDFGDDVIETDIDFGDNQIDDNIDFGIETINDDTVLVTKDENDKQTDGVARGQDALSVLEHSITNRCFMDDLMELSAFLRGRQRELSSESASDLLLATQLSRDPLASSLAGDPQMIADWLNKVNKCRQMLLDGQKRHLLKIRSSQRYLDSLVDELNGKRSQIGKYERLAKLMVEKERESLELSDALKPNLDTLVERTRELQKQLEQDISQRYKGRPVNIMGGITAALAAT